jgi:hypothetical protein
MSEIQNFFSGQRRQQHQRLSAGGLRRRRRRGLLRQPRQAAADGAEAGVRPVGHSGDNALSRIQIWV